MYERGLCPDRSGVSAKKIGIVLGRESCDDIICEVVTFYLIVPFAVSGQNISQLTFAFCSTNSLKTWSHQTQGHDPLLICL